MERFLSSGNDYSLITAIIMNPSANDWEAKKRRPEMEEYLQRYEIPHEIFETQPDGKTIDLVSGIADKGYGRIVAVGGDGTINEVINGIMRSSRRNRPELALIPFGTANDISRSFGIFVDNLENCVRTIKKGSAYDLDLGLVDGQRYFADAFTVGFDAEVLDDRENTRRQRLVLKTGIASYIPSLMSTLFGYKRVHAELCTDETHEFRKMYNMIFKNCRIYAGGFVLDDSIRANDGMIDVFVWKNISDYVSEIGTQMTKQISGAVDPTGLSKGVVELFKSHEHFRITKTELNLKKEVPTQIDGERYKKGKVFTVECIEAALKLRVPVDG